LNKIRIKFWTDISVNIAKNRLNIYILIYFDIYQKRNRIIVDIQIN